MMIDDKDYLQIQNTNQNISMTDIIKKAFNNWNRKPNLVTRIILCSVVQSI